MGTHYETLGVSQHAEDVVIDAAYRALMKRYHPDVHNGGAATEAHAKAINEAYRILRDPEARARYDRDLKNRQDFEHSRSSPPPEPPPSPPRQRPPNAPTGPALRRRNRLALLGIAALAAILTVPVIGSFRARSISTSSGAGSPKRPEGPAPELESSIPPAALPSATSPKDPMPSRADKAPSPPSEPTNVENLLTDADLNAVATQFDNTYQRTGMSGVSRLIDRCYQSISSTKSFTSRRRASFCVTMDLTALNIDNEFRAALKQEYHNDVPATPFLEPNLINGRLEKYLPMTTLDGSMPPAKIFQNYEASAENKLSVLLAQRESSSTQAP